MVLAHHLTACDVRNLFLDGSDPDGGSADTRSCMFILGYPNAGYFNVVSIRSVNQVPAMAPLRSLCAGSARSEAGREE